MKLSCETEHPVSIAMVCAMLGRTLLFNATLLWVSLCFAMYVLKRDDGILDGSQKRKN